MAKPARVNPLAAKYRVSWPAGAPDWQLELGCWANRLNTGFTPYHHLEQAIRLMWPENMWHPWREERFEAFCDPALAHKDGRTITRNFSWMGCGAATKTYDAILLAISWWLADPSDSIVTMTSTTKESSRSRMWAVLRQFWYEFKETTGYDGPHIIDSQMILEVEPGERKHVIYVQAVESGELTKTKGPAWDSSKCSCVHWDDYECARIRDGRHTPDDDEYHRRACECCCHERDVDEDDDL